MAYILQAFNPRAGLRGSLGSIPGGTGSSSDPYGGIGGGTAAQLRALVAKGMTFKVLRAETGIANGEKYIFCQASDKKFYKFKMSNTGLGNTPSDSKAIAWFNAEVAVAKPASTATVTSPGASVTNTTGPVPGTPGLVMVTPRPVITPVVTPGMRLSPGALTGGGGESKTPWGLIAGGVAVLAIGAVVMRRREGKG